MKFHSCFVDIMSSCCLYICHLVYDDKNFIATGVLISWQSLFHYFDDEWYLWYSVGQTRKIKIQIANNNSNLKNEEN